MHELQHAKIYETYSHIVVTELRSAPYHVCVAHVSTSVGHVNKLANDCVKTVSACCCRLLGVSVVLLAAANVFLGLHIAKPVGTHKFVAGYSAFLAAILALAVIGTAVNEYRAQTIRKKPLGLMGSSQQASEQFHSGSYT